jgi:putative chitinase
MQLTEAQCKSILKGNSEYKEWCDIFNKFLSNGNIDTPIRAAAFLSQTCHESNYFRVLEENGNYSSKALSSIWGKRFSRAGKNPDDYHRQPIAIFNFVYADRMGNGTEASEDGYAFRGKGAIQCTGRDNTTKFAKSVDLTVAEALEYLMTKEGALVSALWYWNTNNLNKYADVGDLKTLCKRINGGFIGLADRNHKYEKFLAILGGEIEDYEPQVCLKVGSRGDDVRAVQNALGLDTDGVFGKMTEKAVMEWQLENKLVVDGIVGPQTLAKML